MRKSLFNRYFGVCCVMILLCIVTLGVTLLLTSAQYFTSDKYALLEKNARNAAWWTSAHVVKVQAGPYRVMSDVLTAYKTLSDAIGADIFLVDLAGKTILCTHTVPCNHTTYLMPGEIIDDAVYDGSYRGLGRIPGIYPNEQFFTVGMPVVAFDNEIVGVVFVSTSARALNVFLAMVARMFSLSSLFFFLIALMIVYMVTNRLVKPLREMVRATHSFSSGDFTVRVPVEGDDEISQLAIGFNNMASSLATLESVRRSFIANVSHELRTPMTTIAGFIDGILDGTIPTEKQPYYLKIVSDEVKRLSRVIRSMLNIAKIEAGEMEMTPTQFDIHDIICSTVFIFEQQIEEKQLEIRGLEHDRVLVEADTDLMHQVVYNLLENAVKFTNVGGYIEIGYRVEGASTQISVKNSGGGVSKDDIAKIFDRFYKSDKSRGLDKEGVGLGLHIVRSIITLHSGDILVRSVEGEYSEFVFTISSAGKKIRRGV